MNTATTKNLAVTEASPARAAELFKKHQQNIICQVDRLFSWLMICQWFFAVGIAFWLSPRTWAGVDSQIHPHIWAAIFLGGIITALPVYLTRTQPGQILTRQVVAVAQMLMSGLLIHLTGGRIETHFHVFGSLAILAFYRDWRVLASATAVTFTDHLIRGIFWPESVYGVLSASLWRTFEHAGWVLFEVIFLIIAIRQSQSEMHLVAERQAKLEAVNETVEHLVAERTAELVKENRNRLESQALYHSLVENLPAGIFRKDAAGRYVLVNSWFCKLRGRQPGDFLGKTSGELAATETNGNFAGLFNQGTDHHKEIMSSGKVIEIIEESLDNNGKPRQLQAIKTPVQGADGSLIGSQGILVDITALKEAEAKLEQAHRELLQVSRQAGMAEVATSVLHNVGNVLNSANVSASIIADKTRASRVTNLKKVVDLISAHESDLGNFISNDPKGKQLPIYLAQLSEHLKYEQEKVLEETDSLVKNIIHIKEIVAMQQGYAKASGVLEQLEAAELVEDALWMNNSGVTQHAIKVVREFADVPVIVTDKYKVLQILVNLIRNSKHACEDSERQDKQITLRVYNGDKRVKIAVSDNGVGIPAENLTRIFNHGFTTRKNGHGFGLHSGANAAKELGGKLTASSEGAGQGATFVLELPINQN